MQFNLSILRYIPRWILKNHTHKNLWIIRVGYELLECMQAVQGKNIMYCSVVLIGECTSKAIEGRVACETWRPSDVD